MALYIISFISLITLKVWNYSTYPICLHCSIPVINQVWIIPNISMLKQQKEELRFLHSSQSEKSWIIPWNHQNWIELCQPCMDRHSLPRSLFLFYCFCPFHIEKKIGLKIKDSLVHFRAFWKINGLSPCINFSIYFLVTDKSMII